ncbi:MAG: hypothetical protein ACLQGV_01590 [Bryobacteraceae bacterium]
MRTLLAFCTVASGWLFAQPGPVDSCQDSRHLALQRNSLRLDLTVDLDRSEYVPYEVYTTTITLRNPTAQPLEVYEPLQHGSMHLEFAGGTTGAQCVLRPYPGPLFSCSGTAVTVQPGQALRRTFRSDAARLWLFPPSRVPLASAPGVTCDDCSLAAVYRGQRFSRPFRVVPATLEGHAEVKLRAPKIVHYPDGATREFERTVEAFVLSYGGKRYLFIEASANARPRLRVAELDAGESLDALQEESDGRITARILSGAREVRYISRPDPEPQ